MKLPNGEIVISDMSAWDLKNLIQTGESTHLEFKRTIPTAKKIAREIAAFANTSGGTILIGVDDNGTVPGIREYFEEEFLLFQAAHDHCVPEVPIEIELVHFGPVDVMVVRVPESSNKPIYNKNKKKRRVYVRREDASMLASDELTEILKQQYSPRALHLSMAKTSRCCFGI